MAFIWKDEWAIGNATIDAQHKQLFKAINDLLDACSSGQGRAKLEPTLQFLIDYTNKHFNDEEKIQQQCNYPDAPNHKKLHIAFKSTVQGLAQKLLTEGSSIAIVAKVNSDLGDWLVKHVQREDKKIADFIRNQDA